MREVAPMFYATFFHDRNYLGTYVLICKKSVGLHLGPYFHKLTRSPWLKQSKSLHGWSVNVIVFDDFFAKFVDIHKNYWRISKRDFFQIPRRRNIAIRNIENYFRQKATKIVKISYHGIDPRMFLFLMKKLT
jgi:hypothetical protein